MHHFLHHFLHPAYCLLQAQYSKIHDERIVSLMSDCVFKVNYVVVNSREQHSWFTKQVVATFLVVVVTFLVVVVAA